MSFQPAKQLVLNFYDALDTASAEGSARAFEQFAAPEDPRCFY